MSRSDAWSNYIKAFEERKQELLDMEKRGEIAYVYTNGFVMLNKENINGGIFNNDATVPYYEVLDDKKGKRLYEIYMKR